MAPTTLFCVWRVVLDRLPTRGNLLIRGVSLRSIVCPLSISQIEIVNHLFISYRIVSQPGSQ